MKKINYLQSLRFTVATLLAPPFSKVDKVDKDGFYTFEELEQRVFYLPII